MNQAHREIQAIKAQLGTIRADEPRQRRATTLLVPPTMIPLDRNTPDGVEPLTTGMPPGSSHPASQSGRRSPHSSEYQPNRQTDRSQQLNAQAQHINRLSQAQEEAILELRAIAQRLDGQSPLGRRSRPVDLPRVDLPRFDAQPISVPHVEQDRGVLVLTSRPLEGWNSESDYGNQTDLYQAKQDALSTAQALRQVQEKRRGRSLLQRFGNWLSGGSSSTSEPVVPSSSVFRRPVRSQSFTLSEGITLLLGSILVRAFLGVVLQMLPSLFIPVVIVLITPAAIAVYRTTLTPQVGFIWGCRLVVIMTGLLLGGRL